MTLRYSSLYLSGYTCHIDGTVCDYLLAHVATCHNLPLETAKYGCCTLEASYSRAFPIKYQL